ncbi:MAG: GumC family protein [Vibrio sp.]
MKSLFVEDEKKLESIIDFSRLYKSLKKNWWKIILFSVLVTSASLPFILWMTPKYQAYSTILLKDTLANSTTFEKALPIDSTRAQYYETQYELMKSRALVSNVVDKLKLYNEAEFIGKLPIYDKNFAERNELSIQYVYEHMSILPVRKTQMVVIGFESVDPKMSANVANGIAEAFIDYSISDSQDTNKDVTSFLKKQVADLQASLNKKEADLNRFLKNEDLITFYGVDGFQTKQLSLLTEDLAQAKAERVSLQSIYNTVSKYKANQLADLLAIPDISRHPNIENIRQQLIEQQTVISDLEKRYGPKHERVIQAHAQLSILDRQANVLIQEVAQGIQEQYKAAAFKEEQLRLAVQKHAGDFQQLGVKKTRYDNMVDDINHTRSLYNQLLQRMNEIQVDNRFTESTSKIVDLAQVPKLPTKPNKKLLIAVVTIMSLLLASMFVLFFAALNNKILTIIDLNKRLGLTVLGEIKNYKTPDSSLIDMLDHPVKYSHLDETMLAMRTELLLLDTTDKLISLISTNDGEGKSLVTGLVAKSLSIDHKVLVVDLNLSSSELTSKSFKLGNNQGLLDVIYRNVDFNDVIHKTKHFDFLPIGIVKSDIPPVVVLSQTKLKVLFNELRQYYDYVFIDSPSILDNQEIHLIQKFIDAGILVVESNSAPSPVVVSALNKIKNVKVLGGVLNKVDDKFLEMKINISKPAAVKDMVL